MADRFVLEVPRLPEHLATVRIFAASLARRLGFDEDTVADLKLALSEAGTLALTSGAEPVLHVEATIVPDGLDFVVEVPPAALEVDDDVGGLDLIRALFADAAAGAAGIVVPVRRPAR